MKNISPSTTVWFTIEVYGADEQAKPGSGFTRYSEYTQFIVVTLWEYINNIENHRPRHTRGKKYNI